MVGVDSTDWAVIDKEIYGDLYSHILSLVPRTIPKQPLEFGVLLVGSNQ